MSRFTDVLCVDSLRLKKGSGGNSRTNKQPHRPSSPIAKSTTRPRSPSADIRKQTLEAVHQTAIDALIAAEKTDTLAATVLGNPKSSLPEPVRFYTTPSHARRAVNHLVYGGDGTEPWSRPVPREEHPMNRRNIARGEKKLMGKPGLLYGYSDKVSIILDTMEMNGLILPQNTNIRSQVVKISGLCANRDREHAPRPLQPCARPAPKVAMRGVCKHCSYDGNTLELGQDSDRLVCRACGQQDLGLCAISNARDKNCPENEDSTIRGEVSWKPSSETTVYSCISDSAATRNGFSRFTHQRLVQQAKSAHAKEASSLSAAQRRRMNGVITAVRRITRECQLECKTLHDYLEKCVIKVFSSGAEHAIHCTSECDLNIDRVAVSTLPHTIIFCALQEITNGHTKVDELSSGEAVNALKSITTHANTFSSATDNHERVRALLVMPPEKITKRCAPTQRAQSKRRAVKHPMSRETSAEDLEEEKQDMKLREFLVHVHRQMGGSALDEQLSRANCALSSTAVRKSFRSNDNQSLFSDISDDMRNSVNAFALLSAIVSKDNSLRNPSGYNRVLHKMCKEMGKDYESLKQRVDTLIHRIKEIIPKPQEDAWLC